MTSFSFGFSGDDIEDDANEVNSTSNVETAVAQVEAEPPTVHKLEDLVCYAFPS
jgi:hypothetical protein